ncbi:MAG: hypothetical protein IPH35_02955 [Rhodoferax sp.]|nr:hypothetical protein [Rhodoferax sp.]
MKLERRCFLSRVAVLVGALVLAIPVAQGFEEIAIGSISPQKVFPDPQAAALVDAIGREDIAGIDARLAEGADINAFGVMKITPLHWAVAKEGIKANVIEHLFRKGANPALISEFGTSPAWDVVNTNRADLLEIILKNGADPNVRYGQDSLLAKATYYQRDENINVLLKYGADVNAVSKSGQGILCLETATVGRFDLLVRYLDLGLNVGLVNCARLLEDSGVWDGSPQDQWREQALALMKEKGVTFPVPSIPGPKPELVLKPGARLEVTSSKGNIAIVAGKRLARQYQWDGCALESNMHARTSRWYGKLGAYDGGGRYGKDHYLKFPSCKGVTRTSVQEAQLNFPDLEAAEKWIGQNSKSWTTVWTNDGLFVSWVFSPMQSDGVATGALSLELTLLCINGQRPTKLAGSSDQAIKLVHPNGPGQAVHECAVVSNDVMQKNGTNR